MYTMSNKSLSLNQRLGNLESMFTQFMNSAVMGQAKPSRSKAPSHVTPKHTSPQVDVDPNLVYITVEDGKRIKLPKRMFMNGKALKSRCTVNGTRFKTLATDQGRSAPINPREVFEAEPGDVLEFTRVKGTTWTCEIVDNDITEAPSKPKHTSKGKGKSKPKRDPEAQAKWDAAPRFKTDGDRDKNVRTMIRTVAEQVVENYNDDEFESDADAIKATNSKAAWGLKVDPREYLTFQQRARFKSAVKKLGLTMKDACILVNKRVEF
jgi:hypothetical protein